MKGKFIGMSTQKKKLTIMSRAGPIYYLAKQEDNLTKNQKKKSRGKYQKKMSIDTIMEDSDYSVSDTDAIICRSSDTSGWTKSLISDPNIINSSSTSEDEYQQQKISTAADDDLMIIASSSGESCSSVDSNNQSEQRIRIFNVDMIMGSYSQLPHECPICGLEFLSGQALGAHMTRHRASIVKEDEYHQQQILTAPGDGGGTGDDLNMIIVSSGESTSSANRNNQTEQRIRIFNVDMIMGSYSQLPHECSICGLEFLSAQALEGHMTRHRASIVKEDEYHQQQILTATGDGGGTGDDSNMIIVSSGEPTSSANRNNQSEQRIRIFNVDMIMGSYSQLHECSICGLEFLSAQALGAHMTWHRDFYGLKDCYVWI